MRMISRRTAGALLAVLGAWANALEARAQDPSAASDNLQQSVLRIPATGNFPLSKRATLGRGKSMLVQFPFELKDVLVADPEKVDAVVQSSNRVFLIGKGQGETNAFFFDTKGQQILLLEISVGADLTSPAELRDPCQDKMCWRNAMRVGSLTQRSATCQASTSFCSSARSSLAS